MEGATILTCPSTGLSGILLSVRTLYPWRTRIWKKYQHYIDVRGEVLPTPLGTTTALRPLNNLEKTGPSEIERNYNVRKQQTRFYWVCSWELMKSAIILTPPSTGLSSVLLSEAGGEFNDASTLGRSLNLCKALHITNRDRYQNNERPWTLALLNSPLVRNYIACPIMLLSIGYTYRAYITIIKELSGNERSKWAT